MRSSAPSARCSGAPPAQRSARPPAEAVRGARGWRGTLGACGESPGSLPAARSLSQQAACSLRDARPDSSAIDRARAHSALFPLYWVGGEFERPGADCSSRASRCQPTSPSARAEPTARGERSIDVTSSTASCDAEPDSGCAPPARDHALARLRHVLRAGSPLPRAWRPAPSTHLSASPASRPSGPGPVTVSSSSTPAGSSIDHLAP